MRTDRQRLDKWLWFARFARTRSLAAKLVTDGFVRLNGQRVENAARAVAIDDVLTIAAPHVTAVVRVAALGERRSPAPEARRLYADLAAPAMPDGEPARDDTALVSGPDAR